MTKKPLVTVLIPVYNQEKLVIRALESIPMRDDIEVIVIDDGSTDNTWDNLMKFRNKNQTWMNLIFLYNEINKGVSSALNKGYDNAKGKYIVILGSDDYFYTDMFEEFLGELDGTDLIYFDMEINDGTIITSTKRKHPHGSVKFMRREFIGNTRCIESKKAGEDYYFYQELKKKKPTEKFTRMVVKHYNYPREGSLSDLVIKGKIEGIVK